VTLRAVISSLGEDDWGAFGAREMCVSAAQSDEQIETMLVANPTRWLAA
jgi:hypothetical protein